MARVVMTDGLINQVRQNVRNVYKIPNMPDYDEWADRVYDIVVPEEQRAKVEAVPDGWIRKSNGIRLRISTETVSHTLALELDPSRIMPIWFDNNISKLKPMNSSTHEGNPLVANDDPVWDELKAVVEADAEAIVEARKKQNAAAEEVVAVLRKFSSLAPALREWPALWELLPNWAQERHKEVVERAAPKPKLPPAEIDVTASDNLSELTTKLAINKMTKR